MRKLVPILAALVAASPALAADPAPVIAADRAMAAMSAEKGVHAALQAYLAPTATVVSGGEAITGTPADVIRQYPEGKLQWSPLGGAMSEDGTLGVTWGNWHVDVPGGHGVNGAYNTAWHKGVDGRWQVILDSGSPRAQPTAPR